MRYHNITTDDMLNGDGLRVVLWVSGCEHHCKGCQNPITWNPDDGLIFGKGAFLELVLELDKPHISGLTFSGGDPLYEANREEVMRIAKYVKEIYPNKSIWLYTGYLWEEINDLPCMSYIDVLVDGKFVEHLAETSYPWAGSTNQRVIDVKKSLKNGKAVLCNKEETK